LQAVEKQPLNISIEAPWHSQFQHDYDRSLGPAGEDVRTRLAHPAALPYCSA
jgi:hypothetical protein